MSIESDARFRPLSDWVSRSTPPIPSTPSPSVTPSTVDGPAEGHQRILVRLLGDPGQASVLLAAVLRVFDAGSGAEVLLAVQGVDDPRPADAQAVEHLLPDLVEDPSELPELELVGDDPHLDDEVDLVVTATGTAWGDALTVLELGSLWRS